MAFTMSEVSGELKFRVEVIILEVKAHSRKYQPLGFWLQHVSKIIYGTSVLATRVITCIYRDI